MGSLANVAHAEELRMSDVGAKIKKYERECIDGLVPHKATPFACERRPADGEEWCITLLVEG